MFVHGIVDLVLDKFHLSESKLYSCVCYAEYVAVLGVRRGLNCSPKARVKPYPLRVSGGGLNYYPCTRKSIFVVSGLNCSLGLERVKLRALCLS